MIQAFVSTGVFIIDICFTLYASLILLRFLLQCVKVDFYNPICQMLIKATNHLLIPLRRIIPGLFGVDLAALVLVYIILIIETLLKYLLIYGSLFFNFSLFLIAFVEIFLLFINIYIYAIIIQAISSWFQQPFGYNPILVVLSQLTNPILKPLRGIFSTKAGIDFSPLVAIICLYAIKIFIMTLLPV